jgi:hypothetical protein
MSEQLLDFSKYASTPVKLTKLKDNMFNGDHPNQIYEGRVENGTINLELSNKHQCFFIHDGPDRYFHTSRVLKIEECEGYDLLTTLNSIYKVEMSISAIPGVQEKHSLKLD